MCQIGYSHLSTCSSFAYTSDIEVNQVIILQEKCKTKKYGELEYEIPLFMFFLHWKKQEIGVQFP